MNSKEYKFVDISPGDEYEFSEQITDRMIADFAKLSGDMNPLHTDFQYAFETEYKGTVAHGMIAGALFSRLVGMHLPGLYAVYLFQTMSFRKPIYPGTHVIVSGKVIQKSEATRSVTIETRVRDGRDGTLYVTGEAQVRLLK